MFEEDEKYFVSVENFSSFLNYSKLKSKLDQIPESEDVIIDFSRCDFVDHTVMENINSYSESFRRKGGHFEIIGLDGYKSGSNHPFALRKFVIGKPKDKTITLTKRQKSLHKISEGLHWNYTSEYKKEIKELPNFGYFKTRQITKVSNILSNEECTLFDLEFSEGELIAKQNVKVTMMYLELKKGVSEKVVKVLRKIVSTEEGTAKLADVLHYEIAGKTGTAQQPKKGKYSRVKLNTFASIFPSSKPQYAFIVMLDSPKTSSSYIYDYRHKDGTQTGTPYNTAGWTSVEVAGKIIDKIGPILATKYMEIN